MAPARSVTRRRVVGRSSTPVASRTALRVTIVLRSTAMAPARSVTRRRVVGRSSTLRHRRTARRVMPALRNTARARVARVTKAVVRLGHSVIQDPRATAPRVTHGQPATSPVHAPVPPPRRHPGRSNTPHRRRVLRAIGRLRATMARHVHHATRLLARGAARKFSHARIRGGEHTYRSFGCSKCHPSGYRSYTCAGCHSSSTGPKDDEDDD